MDFNHMNLEEINAVLGLITKRKQQLLEQEFERLVNEFKVAFNSLVDAGIIVAVSTSTNYLVLNDEDIEFNYSLPKN